MLLELAERGVIGASNILGWLYGQVKQKDI